MRALISSRLMTKLRQIDESAMPSTCQTYRRARVRNDQGIYVPGAWVVTGAPFKCRLLRNPEEMAKIVGEQLLASTSGVLAIPLDKVLLPEDEVEVTTIFEGVVTSGRFSVSGEPPEPDSYATALHVLVKEA